MPRIHIVWIALLIAAAPAFAQDPPSVTAGAGTVKFNALLHSWGLYDSTTGSGVSNFRLRRLELKFSGSLMEGTRWFAMVDAAKSLTTGAIASTNDNKILQDFGVAYSVFPELEFVIGQFKIQTTAEGLDPTSELFMPERSLVGRTYGDKRSPGAMLTYKKDFLKVSAMVSNGGSASSTANVDDTNAAKDLSARVDLDFSPIKAGVFAYSSDPDTKANYYGVNARFQNDMLVLRGELVTSRISDINGMGYVAEAGYFICPQWQPVVRYENLRPNLDAGLTSAAESIGLNYYHSKHNMKIQAVGTFMQNMISPNGTLRTSASENSGQTYIVNFQAAI